MSELADCPVCGARCSVGASYFEPGANVQCERECGYFIHCAVDKIPAGETHECRIAEQHNTLARRAEIGALVERMMSDARSVALRFGLAVDLTDGSEYVEIILWYRAGESGRTQSCGQGGTLLEALRALAKEVGCE